jgi:hypothetical protein
MERSGTLGSCPKRHALKVRQNESLPRPSRAPSAGNRFLIGSPGFASLTLGYPLSRVPRLFRNPRSALL